MESDRVALIERLGQEVDAGTIKLPEAMRQLIRSAKGDPDDQRELNRARAELASWRTARTDYEAASQPVQTEWDTGA